MHQAIASFLLSSVELSDRLHVYILPTNLGVLISSLWRLDNIASNKS